MIRQHTVLSSLKKIAWNPLNVPFQNLFGVELPGITLESQKTVYNLLEKNNKKFDVYWNEVGFHTHAAHHLLAAYSFGAQPDLLKKIFKNHSNVLLPKRPSKVQITSENWTQYLGKQDLWTDYVNFFEKEIKEKSLKETFETYTFHPKMFSRMFSGLFHPLIHAAHGLEFYLPLMLAEGLASGAVHRDHMGGLLTPELLASSGVPNKSIMDIINEIRSDQGFINLIKYEDTNKLQKLISKTKEIEQLSAAWPIGTTEEEVHKAAKELYEACVLMYGATAIRPDKSTIRLDFQLMHCLTSMLFSYISLPYVEVEKRKQILRAQFATALSVYIGRGSPKLNIETLYNYQPKTIIQNPNPWLDIIKKSLYEENEEHIIKVVRALLKAEQEWGPGENNLFRKVAELTIEGHTKYAWSYDGIGWDEEWNDD